jgi:hypothetical protein
LTRPVLQQRQSIVSHFSRCARVCCIAVCFALGCGESSTTETVSGAVTFQGQPIPKAAVTFFPTTGRPTTASTGEDGTYEASLAPGDYTVTVNVSVELPPGFKEGDPYPKPKIVVPPQYATQAKTPLTATVAEGQSEPLNFALN